MLVKLWILSIFFASQISASCNHDNCLRAFRAYTPTDQYQSAVEFCSTFTTSTVTATYEIPTFAATPCANNVTRVSSACSCMPTPIKTSTACEQLVQNNDFGEGQPMNDIPHWVTTIENMGHYALAEVQDFGSGENEFWTKWEGDYPPMPNYKVYIDIAQRFSRCVGIPYLLSVSYYIDGQYDSYYPNQLPVTLQVSVGFNGSTPTATREIVYPNYGTSTIGGGGVLLMLLNPLSTLPNPGTDGVGITLSDSYGGSMEMYLTNITMVAVSS